MTLLRVEIWQAKVEENTICFFIPFQSKNFVMKSRDIQWTNPSLTSRRVLARDKKGDARSQAGATWPGFSPRLEQESLMLLYIETIAQGCAGGLTLQTLYTVNCILYTVHCTGV